MANILIADADATMLQVLRTALATRGHTVVTAHDRDQAHELLHTITFDAALLDASIVGMNAKILLRSIEKRRHRKDLKLGILASTDFECEQLCESLHPDFLLRKPFGTHEVYRALQVALGERIAHPSFLRRPRRRPAAA